VGEQADEPQHKQDDDERPKQLHVWSLLLFSGSLNGVCAGRPRGERPTGRRLPGGQPGFCRSTCGNNTDGNNTDGNNTDAMKRILAALVAFLAASTLSA
jgi:hypothetical protein